MITYDGVPLCGDTPEVEEKILRHFGGWPQFWAAHPSPTSQAFAWMNRRNVPCPRPGTLVWPNGASRWAVGCYLATKAAVEELDSRETLSAGGVLRLTSSSQEGDEDHQINFVGMMALPPIPLTWMGESEEAIFLLVVVDDRFFWRSLDVSNAISTGAVSDTAYQYRTVTWDYAIGVVSSAFESEINKEEVDSVYLEADPETLGQSEVDHPLDFVRNAADLLDAIALNVGCEVCFSFDREVFLDRVNNTDVFDANMGKDFKRRFGYDASTAYPETVKKVIPATIAFWFRQIESKTGKRFGTFYTRTVETGGTGIGPKPIACATFATATTSSGDPDNKTQIDALADRLAEDWYERHRWTFDYIYDGICRFDVCPQIDEITFVHSWRDGVFTRIRSSPWNGEISGFNHQIDQTPRPVEYHIATLTSQLAVGGNATATLDAFTTSPPTITVRDAGYLSSTLASGKKIWVHKERGLYYVIAAKC